MHLMYTMTFTQIIIQFQSNGSRGQGLLTLVRAHVFAEILPGQIVQPLRGGMYSTLII